MIRAAAVCLSLCLFHAAAVVCAAEQGAGEAASKESGTAQFAGMDESVNEKLAEHAGAAPRDPYINTESMGDLWNTLLLAAGGVCGFIIGRWWHLLFGRAA